MHLTIDIPDHSPDEALGEIEIGVAFVLGFGT